MLLKKHKLFNRKNQKKLYPIIKSYINEVVDAGLSYKGTVDKLNRYKNDYRNIEHIYNLLCKAECSYTGEDYICSYVKSQSIKSLNFIVDVYTLSSLPLCITRLHRGREGLQATFKVVDYLIENDLCIRSK